MGCIKLIIMTDLDFTNMTEKSKYLDKKGVYDLRVREYVWSQDKEGYNKTPFIRFIVEDVSGAGETSFTLWMPKQGEAKAKSDIKKKIMKEYFENLGCNITELKGRDLIDCAVGKSCKVALKAKERVIYGSKDGKPLVVTDLDYWYSGKSDEPLQANESKMFVPLTDTQRAEFDKELSAWMAKNGETNTASNDFASKLSNDDTTDSNGDNDWPF